MVNSPTNKELLLSITEKDFDITFFKRSKGPGGQKQNKTSSACRIIHKSTGLMSESHEDRSQLRNKEIAFLKLVNSKPFQVWLKIKIAEAQGTYSDVRKQVDDTFKEKDIKIEINQDGKWIEVNEDYFVNKND